MYKLTNKILIFSKYILLIFSIIFALFPLIWMLSTSIKLPKDYFSNPPVWIPNNFTLEHYVSLFQNYDGGSHFTNSIIIAVFSSILTLLLSIPAAYAIARHGVGGKGFSFWILSQRMLPPVAAIIPLFLLYVKFGLIDKVVKNRK